MFLTRVVQHSPSFYAWPSVSFRITLPQLLHSTSPVAFFQQKGIHLFPFFSALPTRHSLNTLGSTSHLTGHISFLQVSLFMQEGIQVDGARVVLPQPVSTGVIPQVGTVTSYAADGQPSPPPPPLLHAMLACMPIHSQSCQVHCHIEEACLAFAQHVADFAWPLMHPPPGHTSHDMHKSHACTVACRSAFL